MALTPIDVQSLLNVPAPMASNAILGTPSVPTPPMSSDVMGYIPAFQTSTPYSATNLPEFMKGYQQTPSGRFVMSQGLLGMAPDVANVQSLFSKQYGQEYDPLEQQFQESFALDPSLFGNIYRAGGMIPGIPKGTALDSSSPLGALPGAIAGVAAVNALLPFTNDIASAISFNDIFGDDGISSGTGVGSWFKDLDLSSSGTGIGTWFKENFNKPEFINTAQEKAKEYLAKIKQSDLYKSGQTAFDVGSDAFNAYGRIENFVNNPNPMDAFKAIDAMDKLTTYLPEDLQKSVQGIAADVGPAVGVALDVSAISSIANAFEDPSVENLANAYGSLDHLVQQGHLGTGISEGLPGAENIAAIGNIAGGLKALEGGIDSPGEALQVATGAATAASMFGGGTAIGSAGAAALPILGPAAALYGAYQIFNRPGATFGHAIVGRNQGGGFTLESESSKGKGFKTVIPETEAAMIALGELERAYGYKFNPEAWEQVNKRIEFDKGQWVRGANDVIIDALQKGALVPTERTPQTIDFASMLSDARKYASDPSYVYSPTKSMSSYARGEESARQMAEAGAHPLEIERAKMGLDIFQIGADIAEGWSRLDLSGIENSQLAKDVQEYLALNPPAPSLPPEPEPEPDYYDIYGTVVSKDELKDMMKEVESFFNPFANFNTPNYGLLSQPANIAPVAQPVTQPAQYFPDFNFSIIWA